MFFLTRHVLNQIARLTKTWIIMLNQQIGTECATNLTDEIRNERSTNWKEG